MSTVLRTELTEAGWQAGALRPDLPPRWPSALRADLTRRGDLLRRLAAASGADEILDLTLPHHRHLVAEAMAERAVPGPSGGFGAVVSVAGLARFPDLGAAIAAVATLAAPGAQWWLCEPGYRPGLLPMVAASIGVLLPPARGAHLARDLPAALRHHDLVVTDIERFTMPTLLWPLRPFVQLRALPAGWFDIPSPDGASPEGPSTPASGS